jgi:hypothetical protein
MNRENLPNWINSGRMSIQDKLVEKACEILQTHEPAHLPEESVRDLEKIWESAKRNQRS